MPISEKIQNFINWIQSFDYSVLQNADDVATKLISPMFRYLGYPDSYRRCKFALHGAKSTIEGKVLEIAQIYFATDDINQQATLEMSPFFEANRRKCF
ncbi:MAG: hypothetical protein KME32_27605 [Mojavia pulchra JT2-VF2]|jgi:hypothetical protein|uniref:Uncharacterized protein n=1 Tax=Mojavia pulchra JT2-VF2 TaxID=287848 RepID=A0A951Q4Y0_9NOST|nr:hypothetical protein [Mojavia pulchra JT2-VF2]